MKRRPGRFCWLVYGVAVLIFLAQLAIDERLPVAGMSVPIGAPWLLVGALFLAGVLVCAIWDR